MYNLMVYFILVIFWFSAIGMALSANGLIHDISHTIFIIASPLAILGIIHEVFNNRNRES